MRPVLNHIDLIQHGETCAYPCRDRPKARRVCWVSQRDNGKLIVPSQYLAIEYVTGAVGSGHHAPVSTSRGIARSPPSTGKSRSDVLRGGIDPVMQHVVPSENRQRSTIHGMKHTAVTIWRVRLCFQRRRIAEGVSIPGVPVPKPPLLRSVASLPDDPPQDDPGLYRGDVRLPLSPDIRRSACANARYRPIADARLAWHDALMKPNRYEWLDHENERVAREGTGARYVGYVYALHLKRVGGMLLAMLPIILIIQALPETPNGPVQPRAALITGMILSASSIAALRWLKPAGLVSFWALWTTSGMGCLMLLVGLLT